MIKKITKQTSYDFGHPVTAGDLRELLIIECGDYSWSEIKSGDTVEVGIFDDNAVVFTNVTTEGTNEKANAPKTKAAAEKAVSDYRARSDREPINEKASQPDDFEAAMDELSKTTEEIGNNNPPPF